MQNDLHNNQNGCLGIHTGLSATCHDNSWESPGIPGHLQSFTAY